MSQRLLPVLIFCKSTALGSFPGHPRQRDSIPIRRSRLVHSPGALSRRQNINRNKKNTLTVLPNPLRLLIRPPSLRRVIRPHLLLRLDASPPIALLGLLSRFLQIALVVLAPVVALQESRIDAPPLIGLGFRARPALFRFAIRRDRFGFADDGADGLYPASEPGVSEISASLSWPVAGMKRSCGRALGCVPSPGRAQSSRMA